MAINKTAKNMYINVKGTHTVIAGTITKTAEKITITATKGNLNLISNKKVIITGKEGVVFGDYVAPPEKKHPEIVEIQFIDDKNTVLKQSSIQNFGGIKATDCFYGKKVKIKIITKEVEDGTKINFSLKAETKSIKQEFFGLDKLKWNLEIKGNTCETDFFELNPLWYSEDLENYNYDTHKTEIKPEDLNNFYVKGVLRARPFQLPEKEDRLTPIAYLRNYEELIGLFNTDNLGNKDLQSNYENQFISSNSKMLEIARDFSEFINNSKELTIEQIKTRVEQDAKCIWDASIKHVQSGKLDDRPLYWTRNKMQVRLKRHFLFEKDIDFEKSIVKKGTELEKIIQVFEEKSRNYTGIDFSKAGGKKKVLITGFDPFQLDPNYYGFTDESVGTNTFNPSGVVALALNNHTKDFFIQTCIYPVRYEDFDNECVEKVIRKHINEVDVILTTSRNHDRAFDVEKYAIAYRGGFHDNLNIGNSSSQYDSSRFVTNTSSIKTETTLPQNKIFGGLEIFKTKILGEPIDFDINSTEILGSGSNYLSNEVMYRSTTVRDNFKTRIPVGHFHLRNISFASVNIFSEVVIGLIKKILL